MRKMNLGCGFDIKDGWVNIDTSTEILEKYEYGKEVEGWNATLIPPEFYKNKFDFILINHVLCTVKPDKAIEILKNARLALAPNGTVQVIDVNILSAFKAYTNLDEKALFIPEGSLDYKLCMHISGYGTRLSMYTPYHLCELMEQAGYRNVQSLKSSEYDTRPLESLIVEGTK